VLAVVFLATVVIALSSTMLNIALPSIAADLHASAAQTSWALVAYMLTSTLLTILMGQLADSLDRRRLFAAGLLVFTVTSLALGAAGDIWVLVALRGVQGVGAAMLLCNAAAVLVAVFPPRLLPRAMGVYLAGFSIAQVAGPAVGGLVTTWLGWRWTFLSSVPLCLLVLVWGWRALGRVSLPRSTTVRVDVLGNLVIMVVMVGVLTAVTVAPSRGWSDPAVLVPLVVGTLLLPVFVAVELRSPHPAVDPGLFRDRVFTGGMLAAFLISTPRLSLMVVAGLYFQGLQGASPLEAAAGVTVVAVGLTAGSLLADPLSRMTGERILTIGAVLGSLAGLLELVWAVERGGAAFQMGLLLVGLGTGLFNPLNVSLLMRNTPVERAGSVNAVRVMLQSSSLALATAVALSLVVGWVPQQAARAFVAGDSAALSSADIAGIVHGYQVVFLLFGGLLLLGLAAVAVTPRTSGGDPAQDVPTHRVGAGVRAQRR
jgi:MFS family permease